MYGYRQPGLIFNLMALAGIGCSAIMDGHGYLTIAGAGLHFTMVPGILTALLAGTGYRVTNGRLHGLAGEANPVIMAGLL